jgi:CRISPR-associated exonuclease Cas4
MEELIALSTLNDFIFCPYFIDLHNVYMDADEDIYQATPQTRGKDAHRTIDNKVASTKKLDLVALFVYSEQLGVMGKIDIYKGEQKLLVERKYQLKQIFQGQIYQLWGQFFCMIEMGYDVTQIAFYEISTNKMKPINLPGDSERKELESFIERYKKYNPNKPIMVNPNKCAHCIYCNLCDKTQTDNVYL